MDSKNKKNAERTKLLRVGLGQYLENLTGYEPKTKQSGFVIVISSIRTEIPRSGSFFFFGLSRKRLRLLFFSCSPVPNTERYVRLRKALDEIFPTPTCFLVPTLLGVWRYRPRKTRPRGGIIYRLVQYEALLRPSTSTCLTDRSDRSDRSDR